MFNMNQCKPGDKLISVHGMMLVYVGRIGSSEYPHKVMYPDGSFGTRNDEGYVYNTDRLPEDHDIIGFYSDKGE